MSSPPSCLAASAHEAARLLLVADVGLERDGLAAVGLDPLGELVEAVLAARAERDRRALAGERQRGRLADPRRGPGDRGDLAVLERPGHARRTISAGR